MTSASTIAAISPVLAWEQAVGKQWDVFVAGAGPAGATIARQLALRGASVLLVDKASFPRWKVCGCCLNGAATAALAASGLGDLSEELGAVPLSRMRLAVGPTHASLALPANVSLSREALDTALIQAAVDGGVAFLPQTEALLQPEATDVRHVRLKQIDRQASVAARVAVAADGLGGVFLKSHPEMAADVAATAPIGAGAVFERAPDFYSPGTISMACSRGVYVGAVRLEDGRLDIAAALQPSRLRQSAGLGELLGQALDECRFPRPADMTEAAWRGTPALTRFRKRVGGDRLIVVGDAGGYVEPFTGEGMSWAIQAAILAVPFVMQGLEQWCPSLPRNWESRYRQFFRRRERVCVAVRKLLNYPLTARAAVASLKLAPWFALPWMRQTVHVDPEVLAIADVHERSI